MDLLPLESAAAAAAACCRVSNFRWRGGGARRQAIDDVWAFQAMYVCMKATRSKKCIKGPQMHPRSIQAIPERSNVMTAPLRNIPEAP